MNIPIVVVILIGALIIGVIIRYILLSKESAEEKVRCNELRAQLAKEQEKYKKVEAELSDKNTDLRRQQYER